MKRQLLLVCDELVNVVECEILNKQERSLEKVVIQKRDLWYLFFTSERTC